MEPNMSRMISLNGKNYHVWRGKMEDLLYVKRWHLPVFSEAKPDNMSDAEWNLEHKIVCGFIRQFVDDNVLNHISKESHARTLWNKLESLYARKTGNNKICLIKQFMELHYRDGQSISDHLNEFQGVIDQLSAMNIKFDDEVQGLWLLCSLPDSWETFRMSLINAAPDGIVTMDFAKSGVLNEEMRRKTHGSSSHSEALVVENRGRGKSRGAKDRYKSRSKSRSWKKTIECHHCGKMGHMKKNCFQLKNEKRNEKKDGNENNEKRDNDRDDRVATATDDLVIVCHDDNVNLVCDNSNWVIDSGASLHITSRKEFFTSYRSGDFGSLRMGNDGLATVVGIGDVCLETNNGAKLFLKDVRHVPDIRLNLISTGKLDDAGFCSTFDNGQWKLTRGSLVVARGKKNSSLYLFQAKISKDMCNVVEDENATALWHRRLSHMSEKGIGLLAKKGLLSGVKSARLEKCAHCLAGKQRRISFQSHSPSRKSELLELVHSDVCGPIKPLTLGGATYFVTFIDDHSENYGFIS